MANYYHEVQYIRKSKFGKLIVFFTLPALGFTIYGIFDKVIDTSSYDNGMFIKLLISLAVIVLLIWVVLSSKLVVEVKNGSIYYTFTPFISEKIIHLSNVKGWGVRPIRPLIEFGGYGWRLTGKSRAYIIAGKFALFLQQDKGKRIVLDTADPDNLQKAVQREWDRIKNK